MATSLGIHDIGGIEEEFVPFDTREYGYNSWDTVMGTVFNVGDQVKVRLKNSRGRWRKPHIRTPGYLYGAVGTALWTLNVKNSLLPSHEQYSHGHSNKMMSILQMKSINFDFNYPELKRMTASIRMIILSLVLVMLQM